jgi:hypothetical protein
LNSRFNLKERFLEPRNNILEILDNLIIISSKRASIDSDNDLDYYIYISDNDLDNGSDDDPDYLFGAEIRLAYSSVKDYLVSERIQCGKAKIFSATDIAANAFIAKSCLLYIFHYDESDSKATSDDLECFPLLQYACEF